MSAPERTLTDARLQGLESMMLETPEPLGPSLRRVARRPITDEQYALLVEWGGHMHISRGLRPATVSNYLEDVCEFVEWLNAAETRLEAAVSADGESWQQDLFLRHGQSVQTRSGKIVAVRQFWAWMVTKGVVPSNPMAGVPGPKREKRQARRYTDKQVQQILATCDTTTVIGRRDRAVLLFFLSTGARRDEVVRLRFSQIVLRERVGVVKFFGKGAKERTLSFEGPVLKALREWYADRQQMPVDGDSVFVGLAGGSQYAQLKRAGLYAIIQRAIKRAKLRLDTGMALHTLRATYATALYDAGLDIRTIATLMGHNDINTTNAYIAISDRQMNARLPSSVTSKWAQEDDHVPLWARSKLVNRR